MNISINTRQAYSEIICFLNILSEKKKNEIPKKLVQLFEEEKDIEYVKVIDSKTPIKDQHLKEETLAIIAILNLEYWCKDENEKQRLKNLGQNIRELRKNKKMTISELAEKSLLSEKYLQGVEVGNRNISIKNLNKICKALETSPDILLNMRPYNLKTSEEKIFAISEKL